MGSAHFLVYAFEVLMEIYREEGYTDRDAAVSIINNNIFGLDVDDRAYQMSYIALMMKARQYNRLLFRNHLKPNVYSIKESNNINKDHIRILSEKISNGEQIKEKLLNLT